MKKLNRMKRIFTTIAILYELIVILLCLIVPIIMFGIGGQEIINILLLFSIASSPFVLYWLGIFIYNLLGE